MTRRRGVDDDEVVVFAFFAFFAALASGQARDLEDPEQLVDAGNRQIEERLDVVAIEPRAVLEHVAERAAMFGEPALERARRIELEADDAAEDAARRRREPHAQRVPQ